MGDRVTALHELGVGEAETAAHDRIEAMLDDVRESLEHARTHALAEVPIELAPRLLGIAHDRVHPECPQWFEAPLEWIDPATPGRDEVLGIVMMGWRGRGEIGRALAAAEELEAREHTTTTTYIVAGVLWHFGDPERALAVIDPQIERSQQRGTATPRPISWASAPISSMRSIGPRPAWPPIGRSRSDVVRVPRRRSPVACSPSPASRCTES